MTGTADKFFHKPNCQVFGAVFWENRRIKDHIHTLSRILRDAERTHPIIHCFLIADWDPLVCEINLVGCKQIFKMNYKKTENVGGKHWNIYYVC